MPESLFENVLVPIASEADAEASVRAVVPHLESAGGEATLVHVVEKAGGAPDKASVEQREQYAEKLFDVARTTAAGSDVELGTEITYGTDVAETIIDQANDLGASAIVFTPRGGSRWIKLLTGDVALSLMSESNLPVITLPDAETEGATDA